MQATDLSQLITLQAAPAAEPMRVCDLDLPAGSPLAQIIERAATTVRGIYQTGLKRFDSQSWENRGYERLDTLESAWQLERCGFDVKTVEITAAIFKRALPPAVNVLPTTLEAQVAMQLAAVEAARAFRALFAKQTAFDI
jgi:hypothetical protein